MNTKYSKARNQTHSQGTRAEYCQWMYTKAVRLLSSTHHCVSGHSQLLLIPQIHTCLETYRSFRSQTIFLRNVENVLHFIFSSYARFQQSAGHINLPMPQNLYILLSRPNPVPISSSQRQGLNPPFLSPAKSNQQPKMLCHFYQPRPFYTVHHIVTTATVLVYHYLDCLLDQPLSFTQCQPTHAICHGYIKVPCLGSVFSGMTE